MKALNFPLELQLVNVMNKLTQASLNISSKIHAPYVYQVVLVLALAPAPVVLVGLVVLPTPPHRPLPTLPPLP